VPCIETRAALARRAVQRISLILSCWLVVACAPTRPPVTPPAPAPVVPAAPSVPPPLPKPAEPLARDWRDYHRLAAQRLVRANPERSYTGPVPEPLKGIPILEIELQADGTIRRIEVQRRPRPADAQHTTQLAIDAVRRAAPFPPVAHLPKPWKFTEVFLFDDHDRFKPRTLDE
jgi:hypothetical protein